MTAQIEVAAAAVARKVLRHPDGVGWRALKDGLSKLRRPYTSAALKMAMDAGWIERHPSGSYLPGPRHGEIPSLPRTRAARSRIDCPGGCGKQVAVLFNGRISVHDHHLRVGERHLCPASGTRPDDAA